MLINQFKLVNVVINKKTILLFSIGLLVYWVIGLLGYSLTRAQESQVADNLRLEEFACIARDPATFKSCLIESRSTSVPVIKIIAPIICQSASDCSFEIKDLTTSLEISPSSPENKFLRKIDFSYTLLSISGSSNINLEGLTFEDEGENSCPQGVTCAPFASIDSSSTITLNKVTFLKTKGPSLIINNSRQITVTDSNFKESFKTGLEIKTQGFTQNLKIMRNNFENNSGSGLIFQAPGAGQNTSEISHNKFINNHSGGSYSNCLYPCVASQLKIAGPSSNIKISANTISGGINTALDSLGLFVSGIEIGGQNITNANLNCNEITGNRGSGIVQAPPLSNINNVSISENKLWNNGLNLNIPTATASADNCYTQECTLACK